MDCTAHSGPACQRYLIGFDTDLLPTATSDVIVIGSGVAGLAAALAAARGGAAVTLLAKVETDESNTVYAQGGIAAVLRDDEREADDSLALHVDDTLSAGSHLNDDAAVRSILADGATALDMLRDCGCRFDHENGRLCLTREGGHSARRILHADGDATGREIGRACLAALEREPRITTKAGTFVIDLLSDDDGICGALCCDEQGELLVERAGQVILATGGCGQLWRETTNPTIATGDGLAMAYRAGAALTDLEFMQFHPTTLYIAGKPRHLITEAMRGEGAHLRNHEGERFMVERHELAELAPRDVVSQAIVDEISSSGFPHVWLDATHLDDDFVRRRFPTIHRTCSDLDIDITKDWIPVHPSAHYHCGGVLTDLDGRSSVPGLLAAGEVACTGLNGANRLASNSLLEGLVMGLRAGRLAAAEARPASQRPLRTEAVSDRKPHIDVADLTRSLRSLMWRHLGISRASVGIDQALRTIGFWASHQGKGTFSNRLGWEMQNLLLIAQLIAQAARLRQASVGTHLRYDSHGPIDPNHASFRRPQ